MHLQTAITETYKAIETILAKQLNAASVFYVTDKVDNAISVVIGNDKFYIETEQPLNAGNQKGDLIKDLNHQKSFLLSVEKKLSNEKFAEGRLLRIGVDRHRRPLHPSAARCRRGDHAVQLPGDGPDVDVPGGDCVRERVHSQAE